MRAGEEPAGTDSQLAAGQKETRQTLRNSPLMAKTPYFAYLFSYSKQQGLWLASSCSTKNGSKRHRINHSNSSLQEEYLHTKITNIPWLFPSKQGKAILHKQDCSFLSSFPSCTQTSLMWSLVPGTHGEKAAPYTSHLPMLLAAPHTPHTLRPFCTNDQWQPLQMAGAAPSSPTSERSPKDNTVRKGTRPAPHVPGGREALGTGVLHHSSTLQKQCI